MHSVKWLDNCFNIAILKHFLYNPQSTHQNFTSQSFAPYDSTNLPATLMLIVCLLELQVAIYSYDIFNHVWRVMLDN